MTEPRYFADKQTPEQIARNVENFEPPEPYLTRWGLHWIAALVVMLGVTLGAALGHTAAKAIGNEAHRAVWSTD